ncbi:MAG: ATP-dependent zinc protease [Desulfobulbaceae bacterium]|nr:ATP-dependent zinc protease [Desulfobulbaceae bacterium]
MLSVTDEKFVLGWREWLSLPGLNIPAIKAKIDTGARSSALHAFQLETHKNNGRHMVRFALHPLQKRSDVALICNAEIIDYRRVSDSGGHYEMRYVIKTPVCIGTTTWDIEITLTDRETMRFRMLLGRTALEGKILVDPQASYLSGRKLRNAYGKKLKKRK